MFHFLDLPKGQLTLCLKFPQSPGHGRGLPESYRGLQVPGACLGTETLSPPGWTFCRSSPSRQRDWFADNERSQSFLVPFIIVGNWPRLWTMKPSEVSPGSYVLVTQDVFLKGNLRIGTELWRPYNKSRWKVVYLPVSPVHPQAPGASHPVPHLPRSCRDVPDRHDSQMVPALCLQPMWALRFCGFLFFLSAYQSLCLFTGMTFYFIFCNGLCFY